MEACAVLLRERLARAQVLPVLALELADEVVHQPLVKILAAQVRVPRGGLHLEHAFLDLQDGHVERPAAQVEDEHRRHASAGAFLLIQTVRDRRRRGLVDHAQDVEAGDDARVLGGLPLRVVEVRGDGDHRLRHAVAQVRLGGLLHLDQDHAADLLRLERLRLVLVLHADEGDRVRPRLDFERPQFQVERHRGVRELAPDQALGVEHGVRGVHRDLRVSRWGSRRERRRNGQRASAKNAFFLFTRKKDEKNRRVPETKHARTWFFAASPTSLSVSVKAT
jgi:hypothetical protein